MSYRIKARLPIVALAVIACVPVALADAVDADAATRNPQVMR